MTLKSLPVLFPNTTTANMFFFVTPWWVVLVKAKYVQKILNVGKSLQKPVVKRNLDKKVQNWGTSTLLLSSLIKTFLFYCIPSFSEPEFVQLHHTFTFGLKGSKQWSEHIYFHRILLHLDLVYSRFVLFKSKCSAGLVLV